jgi:hypothetical protein
MKNYITLIIGLLFAVATQAEEPGMTARLQGTSVSQTLHMYSVLTGRKLVIEPSATNQWKTITLDINPPVSKKDAAKMIETALHEQANVTITLLDDNQAAVKLDKK